MDFSDSVFIECEELFGNEEENNKKEEPDDLGRRTTSLPGHLSSPIYGGEVDMLLETDPKNLTCKRHKMLYPVVKNCKSFRLLSNPMSDVQAWAKSTTIKDKSLDNRCNKMLTASRNWMIHKLNASAPMGKIIPKDTITQDCKDKLEKLRVGFHQIRPSVKEMMQVERIKDNITFKEVNLGEYLSYQGGKFERDVCVIPVRGVDYLFPTTLVLSALDKMQSMFGLELYWLTSDIFNRYPGFSMFTEGKRLVSQLLALRTVKHPGYYSFCANWEPLMVGFTIAQPDDIGCQVLFETQSKEMRAFLETSKSKLTLEDFLPRTRTENEIRMYLELVGMSKITGYPVLEEEKLLDQLREHGTDDADIDFSLVMRLDGIARRNFCAEYLKRTNRYPNIKSCPLQLESYLKNNKVVPHELLKSLDLWQMVKFNKTLQFDFGADLSDKIKDSACAVNYSSWGTSFDQCAFAHRYGKRPPPSSRVKPSRPRRVIESFLTADPDVIKKIFNDREKGIWDKEDHIIQQCGKELEQKEQSGRAFTKQTDRQRYFQVSLEHNTAEQVLPYVPEQSMTDSEISIANKHLSQVMAMSYRTEIVNIDLQKWCLRHRCGNTSFIGCMYDELFGLNGVFENSHDFFFHVPTFCNNRFSPPDYDEKGDPIPGPFFMKDFIGGNEGMHQKKWTHIAVCLINLALEECGLLGTIMCQGDNIIVLLHFKQEEIEHAARLRKLFIDTITIYFAKLNHKLKPTETWFSKNLHEYGKQRIYKGVAVGGGTKKATKLIPDINDGLSSYHSCISTINTSTEAIAKASVDADVAFIINQMLVTNFLLRKSIVPTRITDLDLRAILMTPADFGGLPLSSLKGHSIRGHDDHITNWVSLLQTTQEAYPELGRRIVKMWQIIPERPPSTPRERTRLYEDPYSLNIKSLPSADSQIKDITLAYLKSSSVTNPMIKKLYSEEFSLPYQSIVSQLDKMDPCYPQLGNILLKKSNAGLGLQMQSKLTSSKTIEKAANNISSRSLLSIIDEFNDKLITGVRALLTRDLQACNRRYLDNRCPCVIADELREKSWKKNLVGLTKAPHQHQAVLCSLDDVPDHLRERTIVINISPELQDDPKNFNTRFGPFKPYIGSRTKEKVTKPTISISEKTSYVKALQTIGKIKSWLQLTDSKGLVEFCDKLIEEKLALVSLPEGVEEVEDICPKVRSGNLYHRLKSTVEHSNSMVNCLLTVTSHFNQSSNLMQTLTQDGEDYSVFFQYIYASNIYMIANLAKLTERLPSKLGCVLECPSCTHQLCDQNFTLESVDIPTTKLPIAKEQATFIPANIDINLLIEIVLGMSLAQNIEDNYAINHGSPLTKKGTTLVKKGSVSINDFKRCNIKNILCAAFAYSPHCHRLCFEDSQLLLSQSNDLSFVYVCEIFLDSDSRELLFDLLGRNVSEHTMITTVERMSAYVSRQVQNFVRNHYHYILTTILSITFKEDRFHWMTKHALSAFRGLAGKWCIPGPWHLSKQAMENGNIFEVKKYMGIQHVCPPVNKESVITIWRASEKDRDRRIQVKPMTTLTGLRCTLPMELLQSFLVKRSLPGVRKYSYNFLSFIARPLVRISSAANKYIEIIGMMDGLEKLATARGSIYCLAEGSGGTFTALMQMSSTTGFYNTWIRADIDNRDCATDFKPPAAVVAGIPKDRMPENFRLSSGETNILRPEFLEKLDKTMSKFPPEVVTMDAESVNKSSNIQFVEVVLPVILKHNPWLIIFKMFFIDGLENLIKPIIGGRAAWVLCKPCSSNPVSNEIFLVITNEPSGSWDIMEAMHRTLITQNQDWISKLSDDALQSYVSCAVETRVALAGIFGGAYLDMGGRAETPGSCGFTCFVHLREVLTLIDRVNSHEGDHVVNVIIRAGGINSWIGRQFMDVVFISTVLGMKTKNLCDALLKLSSLDFSLDKVVKFRSNPKDLANSPLLVNFIRGDFLEKWNDSKFFMRNWRPEECSHAFEPIFKKHKESLGSLAYRFYKLLSMFGLIEVKSKFRFFDK